MERIGIDLQKGVKRMTNEEYEEIKKRIIEELKAEKALKEQRKKETFNKPGEFISAEKKRIQELVTAAGYKDVESYISYDGCKAVCANICTDLLNVCRIWVGAYRVGKDCQGYRNIFKETTVSDRTGDAIVKLMNRLIDVLGEEDWQTEAQ